jgi:hypothetical protein
MSSTTLDEDTASGQSSTPGKFATGISAVATPKITISSKCGLGYSPPLECHKANDGSFVTKAEALKSCARDFCAENGNKSIIMGDGPQLVLYNGDDGNGYLFQVYRVSGCNPKVAPRVRKAEECTCIFWSAWRDCELNGGTGGRVIDVDACLEYYYSPKRGTRLPAEIIVSERGLWIEAASATV